MKKIQVYTLGTIFITGLLMVSGCKKEFLETEPTSTVSKNQLDEVPNAVGPIVTGLYSYMYQFNTVGGGNHDDFGQRAIDLGLDLMTEDMVQVRDHWFGGDYLWDNRSATYRRPRMIWNYYYKLIYNSNSVIEKVSADTQDPVLQSILGQALAVRGFSYFYLTQLFQHTYVGHESAPAVPIYTTSENIEGKPRATVEEVYQLLETDLTKAYSLLDGYSRPSKVQIDKSVVAGILARVYLVKEQWAEAAKYAQEAKTGYPLMSKTEYTSGFNNIGNAEWMWGADVTSETTTIFASFFSQVSSVDPGYAGALGVYKSIENTLYDKIPDDDIRKMVFNNPESLQYPDLPAYVNLKFKDAGSWTSDYVFMRSAEMYLIEAEGKAKSGDEPGARATLKELLEARGNNTTNVDALASQDLLDQIFLQRRIELWGEGQAFLDLKRLKKGMTRSQSSNHRQDAIFSKTPGDKGFIYQIPQRELDANESINDTDQNP